jgi:hypothetical protein
MSVTNGLVPPAMLFAPPQPRPSMIQMPMAAAGMLPPVMPGTTPQQLQQLQQQQMQPQQMQPQQQPQQRRESQRPGQMERRSSTPVITAAGEKIQVYVSWQDNRGQATALRVNKGMPIAEVVKAAAGALEIEYLPSMVLQFTDSPASIKSTAELTFNACVVLVRSSAVRRKSQASLFKEDGAESAKSSVASRKDSIAHDKDMASVASAGKLGDSHESLHKSWVTLNDLE